MNTFEFNGGNLKLHQQLYYMIPISVAITVSALIISFSSSSLLAPVFNIIIAFISYPVHIGATWFSTRTGLYALSRSIMGKAGRLRDKENQRVGKLKLDVISDTMRDRVKENMTRGRGHLDEVSKIIAPRPAPEVEERVGKVNIRSRSSSFLWNRRQSETTNYFDVERHGSIQTPRIS
jgi:hypothetical protein